MDGSDGLDGLDGSARISIQTTSSSEVRPSIHEPHRLWQLCVPSSPPSPLSASKRAKTVRLTPRRRMCTSVQRATVSRPSALARRRCPPCTRLEARAHSSSRCLKTRWYSCRSIGLTAQQKLQVCKQNYHVIRRLSRRVRTDTFPLLVPR